jgi:hypothetical protein
MHAHLANFLVQRMRDSGPGLHFNRQWPRTAEFRGSAALRA